jgi:hypothetical protein
MQNLTIKTTEQVRADIHYYGLDAERYRRFLEIAVRSQRENLHITSKVLPLDERLEHQAILLQGELALSILTHACL